MRSLLPGLVLSFALPILVTGCGGQREAAAMPFASQTIAASERPGANGYQQLYSFQGGSGGYWPVADLAALNGKLYGTTEQGGRASCFSGYGCGTVFQIGPKGAYRVIHRFSGYPHDGETPQAGFIDVGGKLYGTTARGGKPSGGGGTVYEIDASGNESVIYTFGRYPYDGAYPTAPVIKYNGKLYGTTYSGGIDGCLSGYSPCGTIFDTTLSGKGKVLYSFQSPKFNRNDGDSPDAGLTAVKNKLYGTTEYGGSYYEGTVFSVTLSGKEKALHAFGGKGDGAFSHAPLTSLNGELYGTTVLGGAYNFGTVFAIFPSGKERIVHSFKGPPSDGGGPRSRLILMNGDFYGTTDVGGSGSQCPYGCGTVFKISPSGKETILYNFAGGKDGNFPTAGLTELNGTLYGTTTYGGTGNCAPHSIYPGGCGTIFSIAP
ncbi:MAG TPA: choice-of-anchor tandem repeat GloVer-containing protein [Candidatus Cybelea sp.]